MPKIKQAPIDPPFPWARTGLSELAYDSNTLVRRTAKHAALGQDAARVLRRAAGQINALRARAQGEPALIPILAARITALRLESDQLTWELTMAQDGNEVTPWRTVAFHTGHLRIALAQPLP